MIKMNTIGVMVMVYSIIGKKSSRPGCRAEHRATDSRLQTRRKRASRTLEGLHLSSCYFLKRSKTDISQSVKSIPRFLGAAPGRPFRDVRHFFLTWRRFFAGPLRTPRRVTTHCHLSQSSVRSRPVILLFADRATQNAHRRWPPPRLTALQLLLWFS